MTIDERIIDQTLFSDLDEIEASLCYIDDWIKAITELRAAREVVAAAKAFDEVLCITKFETNWGFEERQLHETLEKYKETRRG